MGLEYIAEKFLDEKSILDYGTQRDDLEFRMSCSLRLQEAVGNCCLLFILIYFIRLLLAISENVLRQIFSSPDTAFLMFFICKGKRIQKNTNNSVQNIVFHQFNVRWSVWPLLKKLRGKLNDIFAFMFYPLFP